MPLISGSTLDPMSGVRSVRSVLGVPVDAKLVVSDTTNHNQQTTRRERHIERVAGKWTREGSLTTFASRYCVQSTGTI